MQLRICDICGKKADQIFFPTDDNLKESKNSPGEYFDICGGCQALAMRKVLHDMKMLDSEFCKKMIKMIKGMTNLKDVGEK